MNRFELPVSRPLRRLPLAEQTAAHLRDGLESGRWVGQLPGVIQLAGELLVSNQTVRAALRILEEEGRIEDGGAGRRRKIVLQPTATSAQRPLRIGLMLYEPLEQDDAESIKLILGIRNAIEAADHTCVFSARSLSQMNDNLPRISRLVKAAEADAWVVFAASRVVLEWFLTQPFPVFSYSGRFEGLPIACCAGRVAPAIESAVNRLVDQGHRRIVLLAPTVLRKPTPIPSYQRYLSLLAERGIVATDYNLPHFEDTTEGLESCLEELFRITPPTALLLQQPNYCAALFCFLVRRQLQMPRDVSVICMEMEPTFKNCLPALDHFYHPMKDSVARISRWVNGIAKGRPDQSQVSFDVVYVPGDTVGPAKK